MFSILVVCTGNICRSPIAAQHLQQELGDLGVSVTSSGIFASVDQPITPEAIETFEKLTSRKTAEHQARQFNSTQVKNAQLVLALTREQRTHILGEVPSALSKVFTLREFARLCTTLTPEQFALARRAGDHAAQVNAATGLVAMARGRTAPPENANDDDIVDPYLKSDEIYQTAIAQIIEADNQVIRFIRTLLTA